MNLDQLRRKMQGIDLSALARRTGVNVRTLRRIRNRGQAPRMDTASKIEAGIRAIVRQVRKAVTL